MIEIREPGQLRPDEREFCMVQVCLLMPSSCSDDCDEHICEAPATHAYGNGFAFCPRHWADEHPVVVAPAYRAWWEAHRPKPVLIQPAGAPV